VRKRNALTTAGLVVLLGAALAAQQKPNFSGQWVPVDREGRRQVVEHTATSLTIGDASARGGQRFVYKLDGSETRNVTPTHAGDIVTVSKAWWSGDALTLASATTYPTGRKRDDRQVWSLDKDGRLVVEHTQTTPAGLKTTKVVYTKAQAPPKFQLCVEPFGIVYNALWQNR
jgi:hypothetical protein